MWPQQSVTKNKEKIWPQPCVSDKTLYHYDYHTSDNNTRTTKYKTTVCHADWRKATATGRQWRVSIKRQNTAPIVPENNGLQTTICFHVSQQMSPADNTNRKQRAALNINILYIQCASNTSLVSAKTPVNDIWTSTWITAITSCCTHHLWATDWDIRSFGEYTWRNRREYSYSNMAVI